MNQLCQASYTGQNKIHFSGTNFSDRNRLLSRQSKTKKRKIQQDICFSRQSKRQYQYQASVQNIKYKVYNNAYHQENQNNLHGSVENNKKYDFNSPSLLFSRNNNIRTISQHHKRINEKNPLGLNSNIFEEKKFPQNYVFYVKKQEKMLCETAKQSFNQGQQRPQSKQQARSKLGSRTSIRNQLINIEQIPKISKKRPDTSKELRVLKSSHGFQKQDFNTKKRNISLQNCQEVLSPIPTKIVKRNIQHKVSASLRKKSQSQINKVKFQTSLDPQFLALFAS